MLFLFIVGYVYKAIGYENKPKFTEINMLFSNSAGDMRSDTRTSGINDEGKAWMREATGV